MLFNSNFYSELIPSYTAQDFNEDEWYLKVSDYNDIEEEMADLINKFNNKREIAFTFDEQKVTLLGYYANIYYEDFVDYVAVYNKYKTNSTIFDGTYSKLKNLPIFAKRGDQEYQVIEKGDNYYIDISFSNITQAEWQNKVAFDAVVADIQAEIEELKEEASKTPSKFTIYNYTYGLSANTAWNGNDLEKVDDECTCTYTKLKYETTKSMFKSEIYDKIIKAFQSTQRDSIGEVYLYDNLFLYYVVDDSQNIITDYGDFNIDSNGLIYNYGTQEDDDDLLIWDTVD
jgi:hypothetical protein